MCGAGFRDPNSDPPAATETLPKPRAGDAWVLRHICHDWNDADAARILAALRAAIGDTPVTLCLVEVEASCARYSSCRAWPEVLQPARVPERSQGQKGGHAPGPCICSLERRYTSEGPGGLRGGCAVFLA